MGRSKALRSVPPTAQRCIVADQDRLFVSAMLGDAVKVLDAATGKVLATHAVTEGTREFVKVGESLSIDKGRAILTVMEKSGKKARLAFSAVKEVAVNKLPRPSSINELAKKGIGA